MGFVLLLLLTIPSPLLAAVAGLSGPAVRGRSSNRHGERPMQAGAGVLLPGAALPGRLPLVAAVPAVAAPAAVPAVPAAAPAAAAVAVVGAVTAPVVAVAAVAAAAAPANAIIVPVLAFPGGNVDRDLAALQLATIQVAPGILRVTSIHKLDKSCGRGGKGIVARGPDRTQSWEAQHAPKPLLRFLNGSRGM